MRECGLLTNLTLVLAVAGENKRLCRNYGIILIRQPSGNIVGNIHFVHSLLQLWCCIKISEIHQAIVQRLGDGFAGEVLASEHQFLLGVAVWVHPVAAQAFVAHKQLLQLVVGHGGIPLTGIVEAHLLACLFKQVAYFRFALEVAYSFGADDAFGPVACHKIVEAVEVERAACLVDKCAYAVFLHLALAVMVVMMVVLMLVVVVVIIVIVVMMLMVVVVVVIVVMMLVLVVVIVVFDVFHFSNPCGRCGNLVEVEHSGV